MQFHKDKIIIIDFGSQLTKLIARRVRDLGVYSEIIQPKDLFKQKISENTKGIILSGGPSTVTKKNFQTIPKKILKKKNTNFGNLLWFTINCKIIWRKNKPFKKKKRIWSCYSIQQKIFTANK